MVPVVLWLFCAPHCSIEMHFLTWTTSLKKMLHSKMGCFTTHFAKQVANHAPKPRCFAHVFCPKKTYRWCGERSKLAFPPYHLSWALLVWMLLNLAMMSPFGGTNQTGGTLKDKTLIFDCFALLLLYIYICYDYCSLSIFLYLQGSPSWNYATVKSLMIPYLLWFVVCISNGTTICHWRTTPRQCSSLGHCWTSLDELHVNSAWGAVNDD